jgi:hypothetical protein
VICLQRSTENIWIGDKFICKETRVYKCFQRCLNHQCICEHVMMLTPNSNIVSFSLGGNSHCFRNNFKHPDYWILQNKDHSFSKERLVYLNLLLSPYQQRKESQVEWWDSSIPSWILPILYDYELSLMLWFTLIFLIIHIFWCTKISSIPYSVPLMCMTCCCIKSFGSCHLQYWASHGSYQKCITSGSILDCLESVTVI